MRVCTDFSRVRMQGRALLRHTLLQQQLGRACERVGHEAALHRLVQQGVRKSQQAHALMMRHEYPHDGVTFATRHTRRRVVDRFIEAVITEETIVRQRLQIATRRQRLHRQR